jgi:hypothetical protein
MEDIADSYNSTIVENRFEAVLKNKNEFKFFSYPDSD